ncbi:Erd1 [Schizosaccharomyces cryophilus OY26]|uniref:Erd1 n=1 Tax=Schizosaccharomyces cryophilus (strain OY26 / ATCC MYA-4695 / CBS 11777 / NBRC 106824 / NRRL Y48691) TaxID=653667 RepID=S9X7A6_SCHCR|nr:Erd1 [Schizosaccharomyces cryophilus OY26]EPY49656.1 Erd1 [Schizosaccharomyces cryophilus OY26]
MIDLNELVDYMPLILRLYFLVLFGLYSYTFALWLLYEHRVDVFALLNNPLPVNRLNHSQAPLYRLTYKLSIIGTLLFVIAEAIYLLTRSSELSYIPVAIFCIIVFMPVRKLQYFQRKVFIRQCLRVSTGKYAVEYKFPDVIFSDLLTSYSRVIADLWLAGAILIYTIDEPSRSRRKELENEVIMSLIAAYPYAIRFRQCLIERAHSENVESQFWSTMNAIKYLTAFPAIFLGIVGNERMTFMWLLWNASSAINSTYSFWWDVSQDWNLDFLKNPLSDKSWKFQTRRPFSLPVYIVFSVLDFVLRMSWVVRILSQRHTSFFATDFGIFLMQFLEVFRRCIWVFFRIEAEASKTMAYLSVHDNNDDSLSHPD